MVPAWDIGCGLIFKSQEEPPRQALPGPSSRTVHGRPVRDNAFEELAGHLLARMRGLRALHLCISYVPALPSLIGLTHLELHAVVFSGVQVCAHTLNAMSVFCDCVLYALHEILAADP